MMAYKFRKLCYTFRFIPSTKTIGFSTRVSEGDQTKNSSLESTPASALAICHNRPTPVEYDVETTNITLPDSFAILRLQGGSEYQNHLLPTSIYDKFSPDFYKDLVQVFQPNCSQNLPAPSQEINSFLRAVKHVNLTSDDILYSPLNHYRSHTADPCHIRESINIDVLTQHHYQRHLAGSSPVDSLGLISVVLHNYALNTESESSDYLVKEHVCCYCSSGGGSDKPKSQGNSKQGPSPSQLHDIKEKVEELVFTLFKGHHDYNVLHKNIVMENNLFGDNRMTVGLTPYKLELFKLRLQMKAQFCSTSMEILNVTTLEQTGVIRVHWRLKGLPHTQILKVWKLLPNKKSISQEDWEWLEAFSYFHIGKDGKVNKHRIDRMMPDNEGEQDKLSEKLRGFLNPAKPLFKCIIVYFRIIGSDSYSLIQGFVSFA
ncbi:hypothetical protein Btru_057904 [Bulinus truncatus]|nr:hypothetical protein Btru_057904 [Bulinus truncatus]